MILSVSFTFLLFLVVSSTHLAGARAAYHLALQMRSHILAWLGIVSALFLLHCFSAGVFAFGFWAGEHMELGRFVDEPDMDAMDYFYFSLINITTLGLGDIYPGGHLRFMAGIESLTGFMLISVSASFLFRFTASEADSGSEYHS